MEDLRALKFASFNNVKVVTVVAFVDDLGASLEIKFLHGAEDDFELGRVQGAEHEGLAEAVPQRCRQLLRLWIERCLELFFLVPIAESFCTDRRSGSSFRIVALDFLKRKVKHIVFPIAALGALVRVAHGVGLVRCGVLIRALWDALLELLHLIAQEVELHALVDIESRSASVVVPKVALHEINLHRETNQMVSELWQGARLSTQEKELTGSVGFDTNIFVSIGFRISSSFDWM